MQSNIKQVSKLTADRTGRSEQMYKDLANFVFADLYMKIRKPKTLIYKLKGIGSWFLRRNRMKIIIDNFPVNEDKQPNSPTDIFKHENKVELHKLFRERLADYDKYIEIRDNTRKKRYATQKLLTGNSQGKD